MNFGNLGVISLKGELRKECRDCLWWEWDSAQGGCGNCLSPVCPIYRQQLFSPGVYAVAISD